VPGDMQSKSGSESSSKHLELISTSDRSPPPVPPPPLNYDGRHIPMVSGLSSVVSVICCACVCRLKLCLLSVNSI